MSKLTQAITMLIDVFYKYSGKEEDKCTLTKGELNDLINNEMGDSPMSSTKAQVDLDDNADGVMDFQEYVKAISANALSLKPLTPEHFVRTLGSSQYGIRAKDKVRVYDKDKGKDPAKVHKKMLAYLNERELHAIKRALSA